MSSSHSKTVHMFSRSNQIPGAGFIPRSSISQNWVWSTQFGGTSSAGTQPGLRCFVYFLDRGIYSVCRLVRVYWEESPSIFSYAQVGPRRRAGIRSWKGPHWNFQSTFPSCAFFLFWSFFFFNLPGFRLFELAHLEMLWRQLFPGSPFWASRIFTSFFFALLHRNLPIGSNTISTIPK